MSSGRVDSNEVREKKTERERGIVFTDRSPLSLIHI